MLVKRKCQGNHKYTYGLGCDKEVDAKRREFGLGKECGCFDKWLISKDADIFRKKMSLSKTKPIAKRSMKRIDEENKYSILRKEFLSKDENKICPITNEETTEIHHKKGRIGDLLNDTRYWVALSRQGHQMVENNPEWAKDNGYSLNRLSDD